MLRTREVKLPFMLRFWLLLGMLSVPLSSSRAGEVAPVKDIAAPQSAFGTTLRATEAAWARQDPNVDTVKEKTPVFTSTWEFTSPWPTGQDAMGYGRSPWDLVRLLSVHGPDGTPLESVQVGAFNSPDGKTTRFFVRLADVNPKWPFIAVEWEILDPAATSEMSGQKSSLATWKNLHFPTKIGQKIAVGHVFTTPTGTDITLNSIERLADEEHSQQFAFDLRTEPGETAPDAVTQLDFDHINGEKKSYEGRSGGGYSEGSHFIERALLVSPVGAGPLSLSFHVGETSISLQNRGHYKRLRFQIPIAPFWGSPPVPTVPATPVFGIQTAHVKGQIESARVDGNGNWRALLWLQSPTDAEVHAGNPTPDDAPETAPENNWRYFLRAGELLKSNGNASKLWLWDSEENTRFVHLDGTGAAPGERSHLLSTWADVPPPFDLTLHLERARRLTHFQTLNNIGVPAFGSVAVDKGGPRQFFTLRRVLRFQDQSEIVGLNDSDRKRLAPEGIAVVIELSPTFADADIHVDVVRAVDQDGRQWSDGWLFDCFIGDAMQAKNRETNQQTFGSTSRFRTVFLPGFGASTSRFSLELSAVETLWIGQTETAQVRIEP